MKQQMNLPPKQKGRAVSAVMKFAVSRSIINQVAYLVDPYWYV